MTTRLDLAYLRKSRAERGDPNVLHKHRATIQRAAQSAGHLLKPEHVYEEIGSGEYLHTRPVFQRVLNVLQHVPRDPRTNLWVMDVDRLARGEQMERAIVGKAISDANALIWMPTGGVIDLKQPDQRLLFQVKGDLAENELAKYKHRVAVARAQMLREGKVRTGNVPQFGYRWSKDLQQPIIQPEEFPILQALLHDALEYSIDDLVERYGLPVNLVRNAIRNPFMCGYPCKRSGLSRREWEWPEQPGEYPAAITRAEWERLQAAIAGRYKARDGYRSMKGWCRDVLRFTGAEGARVTLGTRLGEETYETREKGRKPLYVARSLVHGAAEPAIHALICAAAFMERLKAAAFRDCGSKQRSSSELAAESQELHELRADLLTLERRELRAVDAEDRLVIDVLRREVKGRIEVLRRSLVSPVRDNPVPVSLLPLCEALRGNWGKVWREATDSEKRLLARTLLAAVVVEVTKVPGQREHERTVVVVPAEEFG